MDAFISSHLTKMSSSCSVLPDCVIKNHSTIKTILNKNANAQEMKVVECFFRNAFADLPKRNGVAVMDKNISKLITNVRKIGAGAFGDVNMVGLVNEDIDIVVKIPTMNDDSNAL